MADTTKVPVKTETGSASVSQALRPFESLRREVDRLFEDFAGGLWRSPLSRSFFDIEPAWRSRSAMSAMPAIDVTETDKAYEITAELPGMDEKERRGESRRRHSDHQGREAGRERGENKGLPFK